MNNLRAKTPLRVEATINDEYLNENLMIADVTVEAENIAIVPSQHQTPTQPYLPSYAEYDLRLVDLYDRTQNKHVDGPEVEARWPVLQRMILRHIEEAHGEHIQECIYEDLQDHVISAPLR